MRREGKTGPAAARACIPRLRRAACIALVVMPGFAAAGETPHVGGVPVEFILFALTLLGVAVLHNHTLAVGLAGLASIVAYKLGYTGFRDGQGMYGLGRHLLHEWVVLANLLGLLLGFALLARHFEDSRIPDVLPRCLPDDWKGGFVLLVMIFVLSSFLDNIAAAMIGGTVASTVFRGKVHIGYVAAIVGAANAGGSGSVLGDTTTTMMWIAGVSPADVLRAYTGAGIALIVFGIPAALRQQRHSPIVEHARGVVRIDWTRAAVIAFILAAAIAANVAVNLRLHHLAQVFPFLGAAVWAALLATAPLRRPDWGLLPAAFRGSLFLLALILCASLMPVDKLPAASWPGTLGLGFVSAVFDNIPLTALALKQAGYDWGFLAYAVGFGGSMLWFGSSAGVAVAGIFPEAKSVGSWLRHGWYLAPAYVAGFVAMLAGPGWAPHAAIEVRPAAVAPGDPPAPSR